MCGFLFDTAYYYFVILLHFDFDSFVVRLDVINIA